MPPGGGRRGTYHRGIADRAGPAGSHERRKIVGTRGDRSDGRRWTTFGAITAIRLSGRSSSQHANGGRAAQPLFVRCWLERPCRWVDGYGVSRTHPVVV